MSKPKQNKQPKKVAGVLIQSEQDFCLVRSDASEFPKKWNVAFAHGDKDMKKGISHLKPDIIFLVYRSEEATTAMVEVAVKMGVSQIGIITDESNYPDPYLKDGVLIHYFCRDYEQHEEDKTWPWESMSARMEAESLREPTSVPIPPELAAAA